MKSQPQIEYLSKQQPLYTVTDTSSGAFFPSRLKIFVLTFVVSLIIGMTFNYVRPPVYQSSATLLTSAATAIDQTSQEVDFQHVAIQKQKLLSFELLTRTLTRLQEQKSQPQLINLTLSDIRNILSVDLIKQTNLLSMTATGPEPEILPLIINTWIDVYLEARALSVHNSTENTVSLVSNELKELDLKVEKAREELDQFRKENDISSIAREENEALAKLKGLTQALNNSNEEVVKAKARLDAVNQAISNNEAVVPEQEQRSLASLERRFQELKEKLAEFDKRYTRDYLALQPALKFIPEQLVKLEEEIKSKRQTGKNIVLTQASQEYYAAKQVVGEIRQQLDSHKQQVAKFTTLFSHHQKLIDDLTALEAIQRETRNRLVKIESKQFEKYPQVDVVERANINRQAVSPDYDLGAMIAFVASLCIAFFTVRLSEFLMRKQPDQNNFQFPMKAWFGHTVPQGTLDSYKPDDLIEHQYHDKLSQLPLFYKMKEEQIERLLKNGVRDAQVLILLLLSGLSLDEIAGLMPEHIDLETGEIRLKGGKYPRTVLVGKRLQALFQSLYDSESLWEHNKQQSVEELRAMLYCVSVDSGLVNMGEQLEESLRQTYIIFLVEQGVRLSSLGKIVGYISPLDLAGYADFSPLEEGYDIDRIQVIHPTCTLD